MGGILKAPQVLESKMATLIIYFCKGILPLALSVLSLLHPVITSQMTYLNPSPFLRVCF